MNRVERFAGLKRVNYFSGQLLTADDFRVEQTYHIAKRRLLNRALLGYGVVAGLRVTVATGSPAAALTVDAGLAIDKLGREIDVAAPLTVAIPVSSASHQYVIVDYIERETDAVAFPTATTETMATRIEEGAAVRVSEQNDDAGVAVARIARSRSGWRVDHAFKPTHCR